MPRIDQLYAFVADDGQGGEGIVAFSMPDPANDGLSMMVPCIGADLDRVRSLAAEAILIADLAGKSLRLLRFTVREDVSEMVNL